MSDPLATVGGGRNGTVVFRQEEQEKKTSRIEFSLLDLSSCSLLVTFGMAIRHLEPSILDRMSTVSASADGAAATEKPRFSSSVLEAAAAFKKGLSRHSLRAQIARRTLLPAPRPEDAALVIRPWEIDGVIFDMDGVLTNTAGVHFAAWKQLFDQLMEQLRTQASAPPERLCEFSEADNTRFVDGKPRLDGIRSFLESRGIGEDVIPAGSPGDPPSAMTVHGLGSRKNEIFRRLLFSGNVEVFREAILLARSLRAVSIKTSVVSGSKNCKDIVQAAHIAQLFDVRVDGVDVDRLLLRGKPFPDTFLEAARRLELDPKRCIVVEDAAAGVAAGKAGEFKVVVGVDRTPTQHRRDDLLASGATVVVRDLSEVLVDARAIELRLRHSPLSLAVKEAEALAQRVLDANKKICLLLDADCIDSGNPEPALRSLIPILSQCSVGQEQTAILALLTKKQTAEPLYELAERIGLSSTFVISCTVAAAEGKVADDALSRSTPSAEEGRKPTIQIRGPNGYRETLSIPGSKTFRRSAREDAVQLALMSGGELSNGESVSDDQPSDWGSESDTCTVSDTVNVTDDNERRKEMQTSSTFVFSAGIRHFVSSVLKAEMDDMLLLGVSDCRGHMGPGAYFSPSLCCQSQFVGILVGCSTTETLRTGFPAHLQLLLRDMEDLQLFLRCLISRLVEVRELGDLWALEYNSLNPEKEHVREALCCLGNGYLCTRGAFSSMDSTAPNNMHYPGTYMAGIYNRAVSVVGGRYIENEDLVNLQNWLPLQWRVISGEERPPSSGGSVSTWQEWQCVHSEGTKVLSFSQRLDLRRAVLEHLMLFEDRDGRRTRVVRRRFVSMRDMHLCSEQLVIVPQNWSGKLQVRGGIDGNIQNSGVSRYLGLEHVHVVPIAVTGTFGGEDGFDQDFGMLELVPKGLPVVAVKLATKQSDYRISCAQRLSLVKNGTPVALSPDEDAASTVRFFKIGAAYAGHVFTVDVSRGNDICVEKRCAFYTSRDLAATDPMWMSLRCVCPDVGASPLSPHGFEHLLRRHVGAMQDLWKRFFLQTWLKKENVTAENRQAQMIFHLHLFQLMQAVSPFCRDLDAGLPARGLSGEGYRGHIFWDIIFIYPFLMLHMPSVCRNLMLYHYRRLPEARRLAHRNGYDGACFPWQSGTTGREESQVLHLNPSSGRWIPDNTYLQRHVSLDIAFCVLKYFEVTHDVEFMSEYGAELVVEICRFFVSMARWNEETGRYDLHGVVGPDEFHDAYPGASQPGLSNNAYTNVLGSWVLSKVVELFDALPSDVSDRLLGSMMILPDEVNKWDHVSSLLCVPFHVPDAADIEAVASALCSGSDRARRSISACSKRLMALASKPLIISQFEGYEKLREFDWDGYRARHGSDIGRLDRILEAEGDSVNHYKASKQADVVMLFYLFSSNEVVEQFKRLGYDFDPRVQIPLNIFSYLRRTSHGSTLSRVVYSWVCTRVDRNKSWEQLKLALRMDIDDVQGGTTGEGVHLGSMCGTVDVVARCYTGLEARGDVLFFSPCLPDELEQLQVRVLYRGQTLNIMVTSEEATVLALTSNVPSVRVGFKSQIQELAPGDKFVFHLA